MPPLKCPYCPATFSDPREQTEHIDREHWDIKLGCNTSVVFLGFVTRQPTPEPNHRGTVNLHRHKAWLSTWKSATHEKR